VLLLALSMLVPSSIARGSSDRLRDVNQLRTSVERSAQKLTRQLRASGFQVERGYPMLYTQEDCDQYSFPIMQNCYGNNPTSPYVIPVVKSWDEEFIDPATASAFGKTRRGYSATYRLDPREAIIVLAELPPPGRYMGLQSWVFTKEWLTEDEPWDPVKFAQVQTRAPALVGYLFGTVPGNPSRIQSFSSLSNNINNVVIQRQSGAAFGQTRYFIITPDAVMDDVVRSAFALLGVPAKDVFTEPIPRRDGSGEIGPLGLDAKANEFVSLIRYAMPDDDHAAHAWWTNLPLEIVRVREQPSSDRPAQPFPTFVADVRTAVDESVYAADRDHLIRQVCERWGQPCDTPDAEQPSPMLDLALDLEQFGPLCRAIGMNCLGDGQDASYFVAPGRALDPGWIYAVVGTLGTVTGNATYVALSINDLTKLKGVVNVTDVELTGSAASYSNTVENSDKFYLHYFARNCEEIESLTDGQCTTLTEEMVPRLGEGTQGLFSASVRSYVRPGSERGPLSSGQLRPWIIRLAAP
jgi:hypothetical protein